MTYSTIYGLDGNIISDGLQSQKVCDETMIVARSIAWRRGESVVIEDRGTMECYRVTPRGCRIKPPYGWVPFGTFGGER